MQGVGYVGGMERATHGRWHHFLDQESWTVEEWRKQAEHLGALIIALCSQLWKQRKQLPQAPATVTSLL